MEVIFWNVWNISGKIFKKMLQQVPQGREDKGKHNWKTKERGMCCCLPFQTMKENDCCIMNLLY